MGMKLLWVGNHFICEDLYPPFIVENDNDYYKSLLGKFSIVIKQAKMAGADVASLKILNKFRSKILEALRYYYSADLAKCNTIILNLLKDIGQDSIAVSRLQESCAFPGQMNKELQFFRCRKGNPSISFSTKDMLHLPCSLRAKSGNYRFSIPGNPSLYLSNSSYGCWIETGFLPDAEFNVAPVLLDGEQIVFNLAVSIKDFSRLNELESNRVHTWLKLLMLDIATSYRVKEVNRTFKSEYIISQSIMMACKKLGYSGVAYYSKRVDDVVFARCAINLALFVEYENEYSDIVKHMKMDNAFNYAIYKKLLPALKYKDYDLRSVATGWITNIGNYDRQYPYRETEFYEFDKFLFTTWCDKANGKGKDEIDWGINVS